MKLKFAFWILSVLFCGMVWPAGAPSALANGSTGSSGCVDDTWTATSTAGAPNGRYGPTAVWTGQEMIIWGGTDGSSRLFNTGGRYDPATETWAATSTVDAPSARFFHTAVWTGTEMILWGRMASILRLQL